MTKKRVKQLITATALAGAVTLAGASDAAAGDDDDDDDGGGDPTVVNTGGAFDGDSAVPLAITAAGLAVVAGGAFAVRRRNEA